MAKSIDVAEIANELRTLSRSHFESSMLELIQRATSEQLSVFDVIAETVVLSQETTEQFIVALLQKVVDQLQHDM